MRPLRILHVTPYHAQAWAYGGIPRVVHSLTRGLSRRGHCVTVCTTDAHDARTRLSRERRTDPQTSIETRVFANFSNRLAYHLQLFTPLGMAAFLRHHADRFDVAHLHACRNLPGVLAAHYLRRAGVPYALAPNGTAPLIERRVLAKRAFDAVVGRRVLDAATRVVAVTGAERQQLLGLGVQEGRVRVLPNPMDLEEFDRPPDEGRFRRLHGIGRTPMVLFLGKITPRKRLDVLVRAFARLDRTDARLVIAGNDMGAVRSVRALARELGVLPSTQFVGLLEGAERLEALADADVVVYASEHEVFGLVALEALLAGVPVIVADDCGCGEVVREVAPGGQVVPLGDVNALARAIADVLESPTTWRAAARGAAARVRHRFGEPVVSERYERLYAEMVAAA